MNWLKCFICFGVVFAIFFSVQSVNADLNKRFEFNTMIEKLESKYPIVEKQATILLKLLKSKKHYERIQYFMKNDDIKKANETYIYNVFEKLNIPFQDSLVSKMILATNYQTKDYYITLLDLFNFSTIALGAPFRTNTTFMLNYKKEELKKYTYKLKEVINKYLETLIPVHKLAREKFSDINNTYISTHYEPIEFGENEGKSELYSIFVTPHTRDTSLTFFTYDMRKLKRYLSEYPNDYLKFLVDLSKRFQSMGFSLRLRGDDFYFVDFQKNINKIIEERAMFEDLDDLGSSSDEIDSESGKSQESMDDLNIDDLLPD